MGFNVSEIRSREDAESLSEIILECIDDDKVTSYPFQDTIFRSHDGSIRCMGHDVEPQEALHHVTNHVWENRRKLNREIRKWKIAGPTAVNCGC